MKSKAGRSAAFAPTQSHCVPRLTFSEAEIQVRNPLMHVHMTRKRGSWPSDHNSDFMKCLPPDWPKELSNGSSNKPDHMLLDNKYSISCF